MYDYLQPLQKQAACNHLEQAWPLWVIWLGWELETAMAKALDEELTLFTPQICKGERNVLFHSEWDNLNKILTNVHGSNVVNSTGGIMVQETAFGYEPTTDCTLSTYRITQSQRREVCLATTSPNLQQSWTAYVRGFFLHTSSCEWGTIGEGHARIPCLGALQEGR